MVLVHEAKTGLFFCSLSGPCGAFCYLGHFKKLRIIIIIIIIITLVATNEVKASESANVTRGRGYIRRPGGGIILDHLGSNSFLVHRQNVI